MALPETKSATLPAIEGTRLQMVQAINSSGPMANYRLFVQLPQILAESANHTNATMKKTLETHRKNRGKVLVLLNVIPAPVRNSSRARDAGARHGRNGAFLNIEELDELCYSMRRYCQGWAAWDRHDGDVNQMTLFERVLVRHVAAVDEQYRGASDDNKPQFVNNTTIHEKALVYVEQLKKRANSTRALDLTRKVPQHQSPIYVGCSAKPVQNRMVQHHPRSGLKNSNPLLALTVSCIKHRFPLLEPETVAVPVMPTWTWQQLAVGEQLVTALASSMFYEGGLNIVQAGAHAGIDDAGAEGHVFGDQTFFVDNMAATLHEHTLYKQMQEDLEDLEGLFDGSQEAEIADLEEEHRALGEAQGEYAVVLERERAWHAEAKQHEASLIEQQIQIRRVRRLLRAHREKLAAAKTGEEDRDSGAGLPSVEVDMSSDIPSSSPADLLRKHFVASGDANLAKALSDGRLKLWSFATAVGWIVNVKKPADLGAKALLCMDLEPSPTAFGEFLLSSFLELGIQAYGAGTDLCHALVTVGSLRHRFPSFEPFATPAIITTTGVKIPAVEVVCDSFTLASIVRRMLAALEPDTPNGPAGVALLYLTGDDYERFWRLPVMQGVLADVTITSVTTRMLSSPVLLADAISTAGNRPKFLHITLGARITLPFRTVRAIALKQGSKVILAELDLDELEPEMPERPAPLAYSAELLPLALLGCHRWLDRALDDMPYWFLYGCAKSKWLEAACRLRAMGML
ncbi:hypothetical protein NEMBOFW57_009196 [Staphylotrichum longicolle]|uniref:Uncharacterized protein n=1 Tax=Staphylotrichum longicolle TaxID=669026 RepID=A0AAD4HZI8_9PEZI|nr:hypothetical protein NEMBOFW57_009196 [Staphylotrichum longicolle]